MRLPKNPFHPGEMLSEEFLVPGKVTQLRWLRRTSRPHLISIKLCAGEKLSDL